MIKFTSMAMVMGDRKILKIDKEEQFHDLLCRLGDGRKVKVIIQYEDPRQEWIDVWYTYAREDERTKTITIKHCKDATFIMGMAQCASAAPRHGDKYDQHTGIAVAYAKLCGEKIPEYI